GVDVFAGSLRQRIAGAPVAVGARLQELLLPRHLRLERRKTGNAQRPGVGRRREARAGQKSREIQFPDGKRLAQRLTELWTHIGMLLRQPERQFEGALEEAALAPWILAPDAKGIGEMLGCRRWRIGTMEEKRQKRLGFRGLKFSQRFDQLAGALVGGIGEE